CSLTERIISKRLLAGWGHPSTHLYLLAQETLRESLEPTSPLLARPAKHLKGPLLAPRFLFFRHQALHQRWKVEPLKRSPVLLAMNLVLKPVRHRNMRQ